MRCTQNNISQISFLLKPQLRSLIAQPSKLWWPLKDLIKVKAAACCINRFSPQTKVRFNSNFDPMYCNCYVLTVNKACDNLTCKVVLNIIQEGKVHWGQNTEWLYKLWVEVWKYLWLHLWNCAILLIRDMVKSIHWVNSSARCSFFEKGIILSKPFQPSRADISCHSLKKGSLCRTFYSVNGL